MSSFDYMEFDCGGGTEEIVFHAKKYTKEEAIEICKSEFDYHFEGSEISIEDIEEGMVRYYPKKPERCGSDVEGGCYTYCEKGAGGSFPVWIVRI